jgi:hypothetical protein
MEYIDIEILFKKFFEHFDVEPPSDLKILIDKIIMMGMNRSKKNDDLS